MSIIYIGGPSNSGIDPGSDDPNNTSGLGAPAIIRGTVYAHLAAGVTVGSGQTTTVRQATATGLQNALNYASTNGKFFEIHPGIYEINNNGLQVPTKSSSDSGFVWRGSKDSRIIQFNTNVPSLIIGDATGVTLSVGYDIRGFRSEYGVTQTGNTNANALVLGSMTRSNISNVSCGSDFNSTQAIFPPYCAVLFTDGTGTTNPFNAGTDPSFSCTFDDWQVEGAQYCLAYLGGLGTGNVFSNWYIRNGFLNNPQALSNCGMYITAQEGGVFDQINLEGIAANIILSCGTSRASSFRSLHFESIKLTGANPIVMALAEQITVDGCDMSFAVDSAATGTASMLNTFTDGRVSMTNFRPAMSAIPTQTVRMYNPTGMGDKLPQVRVNNLMFHDLDGVGWSSHVSIDQHLPVASYGTFGSCDSYVWNASHSELTGAQIFVSATYTHYGQYIDAFIIVPVSITSFTITLSNVMGATGNQPVVTGNIVHVRRLSGTVSGTLTVKDDAGTTLTTNTTSAADFYYIFNGTHYQTFTPVS